MGLRPSFVRLVYRPAKVTIESDVLLKLPKPSLALNGYIRLRGQTINVMAAGT
jgi:hypothetical protein